MKRFTASEKLEIIKLVEGSELSARRTLEELQISRSTFYKWYERYQEKGIDGLKSRSKGPRQFWNKIPEKEQKKVVELALKHTDKSPRELAWYITDNYERFISESSVYRILKKYDLITSPNYILLKAGAEFKDKTKRVNEMWQTDFTYFKVQGWGWYYLASVLDDYSRYVISWKLFTSMKSTDVMEVLDMAREKTGISNVNVHHKPRLLSDNGPCYISKELKSYLKECDIEHTRGAPFHPQTQGKIERMHRSLKNIVKLENYYFPSELESKLDDFFNYYNNERYHESINNMRPIDVWNGNAIEVMTKREVIKLNTLKKRKKLNLKPVA